MKKFTVTVHGQNFFIQEEHDKTPRWREFYVHAFLEAETVQEAEGAALELVRDLPKLKKVVMNPPDNLPTLSIDESAELSDWPECTRPLSGFVFIEK